MKKLIILTSSFPYEGGEQFIESEIQYWGKSRFDKIILIPASQKGNRRWVPDNIDIMGHSFSKLKKIIFFILAFFSVFFYKEIIYILVNEKKFFLQKTLIALRTIANILLQKSRISKYLSSQDDIYIYSYWNDVTVYAACILKREKKVKAIFSRVHGFDIYQERRMYKYMPLKRQFVRDMDKVYCLSQGAIEYYIQGYNMPRERLSIARLGVLTQEEFPNYSKEERKLRILSLSYCLPVKRIDKMILAFRIFVEKYSSIYLEWTHIGSGELFYELQIQARNVEKENVNFNANFLGQKSNSEVLQILKQQSFDIFINSSESEGIPVSIMEAMSFGIPAIAPNVGGIADLVKGENGYLMSEHAEIEEIVLGLERIFFSEDIKQYRKNAHLWVAEYFNANKNYYNFVQELEDRAINE